MERIYRLNGKGVDLTTIMEHLQHLLEYGGNNESFTNLGIDFEDIDIDKTQSKEIEYYDYKIDDYGEMTIFIKGSKFGEYTSLATISDCGDKTDKELEELAEETIENYGYTIKGE